MPTVSELKSEIAGIVHGTNTNDIQNLDALIARAARNMLMRIDPAGTRRIANLSSAIHDDVFHYAVPSDLKGNKIIDIRPQVNRNVSDSFVQRLGKEFDKYKDRIDDMFSVRHDDGTKFLRISKNVDIEAAVVLHNMDSITFNGTWSVGGDATNLTEDGQFFISGSNSLNFDLDGSSTSGHIENTNMDKDDLSAHEDVGSLFAWVYFPDSSIITNVNLRWGSSSTAYWDRTVTEQHNSNAFRNGWNLLRFEWNGASETGSPDSSNVDYLRVTITYDGTAETDIRVDNIFSSVGEIYEIEYYSNALFKDTSGSWNTTISTNDDTINLDQDAYNIFIYEIGILAAQQVMGADGVSDVNFFRGELHGDGTQATGLYNRYKIDHPSEHLKANSTYYRMRGVHFGLSGGLGR